MGLDTHTTGAAAAAVSAAAARQQQQQQRPRQRISQVRYSVCGMIMLQAGSSYLAARPLSYHHTCPTHKGATTTTRGYHAVVGSRRQQRLRRPRPTATTVMMGAQGLTTLTHVDAGKGQPAMVDVGDKV